MSRTLPISEVKTRLPELVSGVDEREEEVVVTKNGRPAAILINVKEYERLIETLEVLSDPEVLSQISKSATFFKSGRRGLTVAEAFDGPRTKTRRSKRA